MYVGADVLAGWGPYWWDPFEAHAVGTVTNPNVWILGEPGSRKSTLVKTLLWRMAALYPQRWLAVVDPKGEYRPLADLLDLTVVRLTPGGGTRINPLAPGPGSTIDDTDRRVARAGDLVTALAATTLARPLSPVEDAVVFAAVSDALAGEAEATLGDVAARLFTPTPGMLGRLRRPAAAVTDDARPTAFALDKLLSRDLAGMFDGASTGPPPWVGPGLVLDLSGVYHDPDALAVVMVAAAAWLTELIAGPGPQRVLVVDEAWAALGTRATAGFLQACFKLGRSYGVANLAVTHRPSDLAAQADDGTATAKIAGGLLADAATKIILRQAPDQADLASRLFGLTPPERDVLTALVPGRALWLCGSSRTVVQHHLGPGEAELCDTDQRMAGRPGTAP
jgi:type IV secretory pathway VirB4 component